MTLNPNPGNIGASSPSPPKPVRRFNIGFEDLINIFVLLVIWSFFISFFTPDLMLSKTTTTGGDMGSHYALADYLTHYLIPHGKLIGWYPNWLAGLPMFQFYFIPPYLLMAILSPFISLEVAFKLVTVLGIFLLPLFAFLSIRLMGFKFPAPIIAACFSLPLLFLETYSIYGVNIKSTLAGQFPHGISFAFAFLSLGLMYYGMKKNKHHVLNSIVLSMVILTHVYTPICLAAAYVLFSVELLLRKKYNEIKYIISVGILSTLLTGFWLIPLFAKFGYTMAPQDKFFGFPDFDQLFIPTYAIFYGLMIFCLISPLLINILKALIKRKRPDIATQSVINLDERLSMLYYYTFAALFFFTFSAHTSILYVRFLPQLYYLPLMFAAIGLAILTEKLRANFLVPVIVVFLMTFWIGTGFTPEGDATKLIASIDPGIAANLTASPYVSHGLKDVPGWIKWNYEGLEKKPEYQTFKDVTDYFHTLDPSGRINVEYSGTYNTMGTPRLFEASPVFSERSVMEGLLLESSLTCPYLYYLQKEVSEDSWWPGFAIKMPKRNLTQGAEDLRLFNVKYYAVVSDTVKKEIAENPKYTLLKTINQFQIYSLNEDSQYIEPVKREPVLVVTDDWKKYSFDWMISNHTDVPLAFATSIGDYELQHFRIFLLDKDIERPTGSNLRIFKSDELPEALQASEKLSDCKVTMESFENEEFSANTDCIGKPVYVKVSYFPNWMADGAGKIYLAAPSLMLAFPEKEQLHFYYGSTTADYIGTLATIIGIILALYVVLLRVRSFRDNVHSRLMNRLDGSGIPAYLRDTEKTAVDGYKNAKAWLKKNKFQVAAAIIFVAGAFIAYTNISESGQCSSNCASEGYTSGQKSFHIPLITGNGDVVDSYHLGYSHASENQQHKLVCTAICDESRKDQVFIPSGYVEFDMKVVPGTDNTLSLKLWDMINCLSGNLYIDDKLFTNVRGNGTNGWHDFEFKLPAEMLKNDKIRVKLQSDNSECYGWDFSEAHVTVPSCRCYK